MDDGLQTFEGTRIREDDPGQSPAIDLAILVKDLRSEGPNQFLEHRRARVHYGVGNPVGVDHFRSQDAQHLADGDGQRQCCPSPRLAVDATCSRRVVRPSRK